MREIFIFASLIIVNISIIILAINMPEEPSNCNNYQEMRDIYKQTNGDYGWPEGAIRGCE